MTLQNHYGVHVDSQVPTTGVFQNNHVDWLHDEICGPDCVSLGAENALGEFLTEKWGEIARIADDHTGSSNEDIETIRNLLDDIERQEIGDIIEYNDWLIGFEMTGDEGAAWYWFDQLGYGYRPSEDAEYSAIVGEIYTQVVRSKWLVRCALCSPCYPGQGDADSVGEFLAYSVPPDMFEDGNELKVRIFQDEEITDPEMKKDLHDLQNIADNPRR